MRYTVIFLLILAFLTLGCATKTYVDQEVARLNQDMSTRVEGVEQSVEKNQKDIDTLDQKAAMIDQKASKASQTAQDALQRAEKAHKLAKGKLLYEVAFTDDQFHFAFNSAKLNEKAKAALDAFATTLKQENKDVFLEIQGHTDSTGSEEYNYKLGLKRAEKVLRYLHVEQGIPLQRMQYISYGETRPVADNNSRENRAQNRRVVIVVME